MIGLDGLGPKECFQATLDVRHASRRENLVHGFKSLENRVVRVKPLLELCGQGSGGLKANGRELLRGHMDTSWKDAFKGDLLSAIVAQHLSSRSETVERFLEVSGLALDCCSNLLEQ